MPAEYPSIARSTAIDIAPDRVSLTDQANLMVRRMESLRSALSHALGRLRGYPPDPAPTNGASLAAVPQDKRTPPLSESLEVMQYVMANCEDQVSELNGLLK